MFRNAIAVARPLATSQRNFVSSVLLTRTWENESVAELKREVKTRGLSPKGNKASLILRIQEHDKSKTLQAIASREPPVPAGAARKMATAARATVTADEGVIPGIPPASQATRDAPIGFMNTNIPDISQPDPEIPIQIPYVPDFWASSIPTAPPVTEEPLPKLLVVAGADTHPGGGPSHNLHDENASSVTEAVDTSVPKPKPGQGGLWDDVAEDIGIPYPKDLRKAFWKAFSS